MLQAIRTRATRPPATAAAVLAGALLFGSTLGLRSIPGAATAHGESVARATPAGRASSCQGVVTSTVTTATIRLCEQTGVHARIEPLCGTCPAGVNVVFIVMLSSAEPIWQRREALSVLEELQRWQDDPDLDAVIRVGVERYGFFGGTTLLRLTENLNSARGALGAGRGPNGCDEVMGWLNPAAGDALEMLRDIHDANNLGDDDQICDFIVLFNESTHDVCRGFGMDPSLRQQLAAAQQLERNGGVMMVGCPTTDDPNCDGPRAMPRNRRYFAQAPRIGDLRGFMRGELGKLANPHLVRSVELTQTLPAGLDYVAGSASEPPDKVFVSAAGTELRWLWERLDAEGVHDVDYTVAPAVTGAYTVSGSMIIHDTVGRLRTVPMPDVGVAVPEECVPPPTETPTPTTTPTPSMTPTATATATSTPESLFLPIALFERCDEHRRAADIAIVIDASTSMLEVSGGRTKMAAALAAARSLLDRLQLEDRDRAAIVQFNSEARIVQSLTHDRGALEAALGAIVVGTNTCLPCALDVGEAVLTAEVGAVRTRTIVLLTDGRSNPRPVSEAVARAQQAKDDGVLIFTVGLGTDLDVDALRQIASREQFFFQRASADDLEQIYVEIAGLIPCPAWPN